MRQALEARALALNRFTLNVLVSSAGNAQSTQKMLEYWAMLLQVWNSPPPPRDFMLI